MNVIGQSQSLVLVDLAHMTLQMNSSTYAYTLAYLQTCIITN
jgi:hypothetical protein